LARVVKLEQDQTARQDYLSRVIDSFNVKMQQFVAASENSGSLDELVLKRLQADLNTKASKMEL